MSNYGFNPDELIDTKVELIDKDGFHKVGEVSDNGGNSGGGSSEPVSASIDGIHFSKIMTNDNFIKSIEFGLFIDPSHFNDDYEIVTAFGEVLCYTGDDVIDDALISIDEEEFRPMLDESLSNVEQYIILLDSNHRFTDCCILHRMIENDSAEQPFVEIEPGTKIHFVIPYQYSANGSSANYSFLQMHFVMPEVEQFSE